MNEYQFIWGKKLKEHKIFITCLETIPKEKNPGNASKSFRPSLNLAKIPKKNPAMMVRAT